MPEELGSVFVRLGGDTSDLDQALAQSETRMKQFGQSAGTTLVPPNALRDLDRLEDEVEDVGRAADRTGSQARGAGAGLGGLASGGRNTSGAMIELARGLDDAQYGLRGLQNNLQQAAVQMGAGGPVVLAITAATVALSVFGDDLLEAFGPETNARIDAVRGSLDDVAGSLLTLSERASIQFEIEGTPEALDQAISAVEARLQRVTAQVSAGFGTVLQQQRQIAGFAVGAAVPQVDADLGLSKEALEALKTELEDLLASLEAQKLLLETLEEAGVEGIKKVGDETERTGKQYKNAEEAARAWARAQIEAVGDVQLVLENFDVPEAAFVPSLEVRDLEQARDILSGTTLALDQMSEAQIVAAANARLVAHESQVLFEEMFRGGQGVARVTADSISDMSRQGAEAIEDLREELDPKLTRSLSSVERAASNAFADMIGDILFAKDELRDLGEILKHLAQSFVETGIQTGIERLFERASEARQLADRARTRELVESVVLDEVSSQVTQTVVREGVSAATAAAIGAGGVAAGVGGTLAVQNLAWGTALVNWGTVAGTAGIGGLLATNLAVQRRIRQRREAADAPGLLERLIPGSEEMTRFEESLDRLREGLELSRAALDNMALSEEERGRIVAGRIVDFRRLIELEQVHARQRTLTPGQSFQSDEAVTRLNDRLAQPEYFETLSSSYVNDLFRRGATTNATAAAPPDLARSTQSQQAPIQVNLYGNLRQDTRGLYFELDRYAREEGLPPIGG